MSRLPKVGSSAGRGRPPREFEFVWPSEGVVRTFRVAAGVRILVVEFFTRFSGYFGLGPDDRMESATVKAGDRISHARFTQTYRGVTVLDGEAALELDGPFV